MWAEAFTFHQIDTRAELRDFYGNLINIIPQTYIIYNVSPAIKVGEIRKRTGDVLLPFY